MKKIILSLLLTSFVFADLTFDLKNAIKKNDAVKIKDLLDKGAVADADSVNQSLKNKNYELFTLLINSGVNVNIIDSEKISIFSNACMYGNKKIVNLLIEKGADINAVDNYRNTPLFSAI